MSTETINGRVYAIGKLDLFKQLHVARKLAPLLIGGLSALEEADKSQPAMRSLFGDDESVLGTVAGPVAKILSEMKEEDVDYVLKVCLAVVRVQQGTEYGPLTVDGRFMFNDLDLQTMLALAVSVIKENLSGFFPTGQPTPGQAATSAT